MPILPILIATVWFNSLTIAQDAASDAVGRAASQGIRPIGRDDTIKIMAMTVNNSVTRVMLDDQVRIFYRVAGPTPTEMRISETSGQFPESWAAWTTFAPHPGGPLADGMSYVFLPAPNRRIQTELPRKTFYLQFRRDGRVSNIGTATVEVYKKHVINGSNAVEEAKRQGFVFLTISNNAPAAPPLGPQVPDPKCSVATSAVAGRTEFSASVNSTVGECRFDIFTGRNLAAQWTFEGWQWDRSMLGICEGTVARATTSPANLAGNVRLQFLKATFRDLALRCTHLLTSVTLLGPAGTPWQRAFAR